MATLKKRGQLRRVYSQNIDGFETSAGLQPVGIEGVACTSFGADAGKGKQKQKHWEGELIQLHGSLQRVRCSACDWVGKWTEEHNEAFAEGLTLDCPACVSRGASFTPSPSPHSSLRLVPRR